MIISVLMSIAIILIILPARQCILFQTKNTDIERAEVAKQTDKHTIFIIFYEKTFSFKHECTPEKGSEFLL